MAKRLHYETGDNEDDYVMQCMKCRHNYTKMNESDTLYCSLSECRFEDIQGGTLVMTLKKKWFDMILSGEKTEEYREMKTYWEKRFDNYFGRHYDSQSHSSTWNNQIKNIVFRNGYGNDKPEFTAECSISEGYGIEAWGAEQGCKYYVLKIHKVFNQRNII